MSDTTGRAGPLQGIRVLDFTNMLAGPYCTRLLADLGLPDLPLEEPSFPAAFAWAASHWGVEPDAALQAYGWAWLENQVMAAVKAVPLGQTDGQRMLLGLGERIGPAIVRGLPLERPVAERLAERFVAVVRATVKGSGVVALVQGALGAITFWIVGLLGWLPARLIGRLAPGPAAVPFAALVAVLTVLRQAVQDETLTAVLSIASLVAWLWWLPAWLHASARADHARRLVPGFLLGMGAQVAGQVALEADGFDFLDPLAVAEKHPGKRGFAAIGARRERVESL